MELTVGLSQVYIRATCRFLQTPCISVLDPDIQRFLKYPMGHPPETTNIDMPSEGNVIILKQQKELRVTGTPDWRPASN